MNENKFKIFKLDSSGTLDDLSHDIVLESFDSNNILVIYVFKQKIMYTWIGNDAKISLKKYIPNIRTLFSNEFPEYPVLRNITVEGGFEPNKFLDALGITWGQLIERLEKPEIMQEPAYMESDLLKIQERNQVKVSDFEKIIEVDQEIIEQSRERDISIKEEIKKRETEPKELEDFFESGDDDLELKRLAEIKNNINTMLRKSFEACNQDNLIDALKEHKEITELLKEYLKY